MTGADTMDEYNPELEKTQRMQAIIDTQVAEIERLTEEWHDTRVKCIELDVKSEEQAVLIAELEGAILPFTKLELWTDAYPDGPIGATTKNRIIPVEWIIAARAALSLTNKNDRS